MELFRVKVYKYIHFSIKKLVYFCQVKKIIYMQDIKGTLIPIGGNEDNNEMGSIAAEMFDEIIIRQDKHLRGKSEEELIKMLNDGIKMKDPNKKTTIIPAEKEAIRYAVKNAVKGSLIVLCSDVVPDALDLVKQLKEQEARGELQLN